MKSNKVLTIVSAKINGSKEASVSVTETTTVKEFQLKGCKSAKEGVRGRSWVVMVGGAEVAKEERILDVLAPGKEVEIVLRQKTKKRTLEEEQEEREDDESKRKKGEDSVKELKEKYKEYEMKGFVKMKLNSGEKTVGMEDVFGGGEKRVVIEGEIGAGKTTMMREMAKRWSKGMLWNEKFDVLLYLPKSGSSLESMMDEERSLENFLNENSDWEKVLWILDGVTEEEWKKVSTDKRVRHVLIGTRGGNYGCEKVLKLEGLDIEGKQEVMRRCFGEWNMEERTKAVVRTIAVMKRLGMGRWVSELIGREVKKYDLRGWNETKELMSLLKRWTWLNDECRKPKVLEMICRTNKEDRKSATKMYRSVANLFVNEVSKTRKQTAELAFEHLKGKESELLRGFGKSFVSYMAAEHICFVKMKQEKRVEEMKSLWKTDNDLFFRFCIGLGGNVLDSLNEWILCVPVTEEHLGPFEWVSEDEMEKLRESLKLFIEVYDGDIDLDVCVLLAAKKGMFETLKFLVERGGDIHAEDEDTRDWPLDFACRDGAMVEMVEYLLNIEILFDYLCPVLDQAVKTGRLEMAQLFLEQFETWNLDDDEMCETLVTVCESGNVEMLKLFLTKCTNAEKASNWDCLISAAMRGTSDMVKLLLEKGADPNYVATDGSSALLWTCRFGEVQSARYLIEKGADVNAVDNDGVCPLGFACITGKMSMVRLLLSSGADINLEGPQQETPLLCAFQTENLELQRYLLENGANPHLERVLISNGRKCTVSLFMSVCAYHETSVESIKLLLHYGVDINGLTEEEGPNGICRANPLISSYLSRKLDVFQYLCERGADVNAELMSKGKVVDLLTFLAEKQEMEFIEVALKYGADLNRSSAHTTPLIACCRSERIDHIKRIVELGADVNLVLEDGMTALLVFATLGNLEIVKCLVELGADVAYKLDGLFTAEMFARKQGHAEVYNFLKDHRNSHK